MQVEDNLDIWRNLMVNVDDRPYVIEEDNLSRAWAQAFLRQEEHKHSPIIISIADFNEFYEPNEIPEIRKLLD